MTSQKSPACEPMSIDRDASELPEFEAKVPKVALDPEAPLPESLQHNATPLPHTDELSNLRAVSLVITLTGAAFLNSINIKTGAIQAIIIALPSIGRDLSIPTGRLQWLLSAYSLTFGCCLLIWGRLGDVYGKRYIFLLGSTFFTLMSLALGFSKSEAMFDTFRALQGIGAAASVPSAIGIIGFTFQPGVRKNYAFAFYSGGAPFGSVLGNLLGGFLTASELGWRWIFWILTIIAALITVAGFYVIPTPPPTPISGKSLHSTVDWLGGALVTISLLMLLLASTDGNVVGWTTPWIYVLLGLSFVIMILFLAWQWYLENKTSTRPLMKLSVWKNGKFAVAMIISAVFWGSFNGFLVFVTYFFQDYQALSPLETTLRFIPTGVTGLFVIAINGYLLDRMKTNFLLVGGITATTISALLFALPIPTSTSYFAYGLPALAFSVMGADTVYPVLALFTMSLLPPEDQGFAGALYNAFGQVGRALGLAIATAIDLAVERNAGGGKAGLLKGLRAAQYFHAALGIFAVSLVLGFLRGMGKVGLKKK